jgi:hypothetical protein
MAVPQFLAGNFHYLKRTSVTDVQSVINDLYTQLLIDGWTCTVGGTGVSPTTMQSPVRTDYALFTVVLTRNSATCLYIQMYDHNGYELTPTPSSTNSLNIDASPTAVYFFTGPTYMVVKSSFEYSWTGCFILDTAPHPSLLAPIPFYISHIGTSAWFMGYQGTRRSGVISSCYGIRRCSNWNDDQKLITISGAYMFFPVDIIDESAVPTTLLGRLPQTLLLDHGITAESELTVPIDVATTAGFTVFEASSYGKIAFRRI